MREQIPSALAGERIDRAVALLADVSRAEAAALVAAGAVRLAGRPVSTRSIRVAEGDIVEIELPEPSATGALEADDRVDVNVVFADDHVVVVDKPAGLVVHPGAGNSRGTLAQGLLARYPELAGVGDPSRPGIVHRLDKDTSGLLMVARTRAAREALVGQLAARAVTRGYIALTWDHFDAPQGLIDAPIGRSGREPTRMAVSARGRPARTRYQVIRAYSEPVPVTLVSCRLDTGRTHQIRVHLAAIGHPVVGDRRYGGARQSLPLRRFFLHAAVLGFAHPATGQEMSFESPVPADLEAVLAGLR